MVFNIFANTTDTVSWVANPHTRGTSNILQSCLITTSLCVWTAVHLNIPEQDDPSFLWISYQTWRKLGWLIIGLLAPEMLVYAAWYHRSQAKEFMEEYNKKFGLTPPPGFFDKGGTCHRTLRKIFRLQVWRSKKKERKNSLARSKITYHPSHPMLGTKMKWKRVLPTRTKKRREKEPKSKRKRKSRGIPHTLGH